MFNALQNAPRPAGKPPERIPQDLLLLLRALSLGMAPPRSAHKNGRDSLFPCGLCKSICRGAQTEKGNNILVHISKLAASEG